MTALQAAATVAIKTIPGIRALALRKVVDNYAAQKELWPAVFAAAQAVDAVPAGPIFSVYHDKGFKERDVDIQVCVPINEDLVVPTSQLPDGVHVVELPPAPRVAAITHEGTLGTIVPTYRVLFAFIAAEKLQPAGLVREVYLKTDPTDPADTGDLIEIQQIVA